MNVNTDEAQCAIPQAQSNPDPNSDVHYVLPPRVTAREIAAVAGTVHETVLIAHRSGELKTGVRVGRALTFDASEAIRWLRAKGVHNVVAMSQEVRG